MLSHKNMTNPVEERLMRKKFMSVMLVMVTLTACQQAASAPTPTTLATATKPAVSPMATRTVPAPAAMTPTSTAAPSPAATVMPMPSPTSVPLINLTARAYSQQYEITEKDNGKEFVYPETSRFQMILDQGRYPKENFKVDCNPEGVLGGISNLPSVPRSHYALRYAGVKPGKCTLTDKDFSVNVEITKLD